MTKHVFGLRNAAIVKLWRDLKVNGMPSKTFLLSLRADQVRMSAGLMWIAAKHVDIYLTPATRDDLLLYLEAARLMGADDKPLFGVGDGTEPLSLAGLNKMLLRRRGKA